MIRSCIAIVLLSAALTAQQRTLVVDPATGPYRNLRAAVAASRPGDRIEIHAGSYSDITVTHGLDLDATSPATVRSLTISGLVAHHAVRVDGLAPTIRLTIDNCSGAVHVNRVNGRFTLHVRDSHRVAISNCVVDGSTPTLYVNYYARGGGCLEVIDSTVVASSSSFTGADGSGAPYGNDGERGGDGVHLAGGNIVLIDCIARGGNGEVLMACFRASQRTGDGGAGVIGGFPWSLPPPPNHAVAVGATTLAGGSPGARTCSINSGIPGPAVANTALRHGPAVTFQGAWGGQLIAEPPHLTSPVAASQGAVATISVAVPPQSVVLLGLAIWHDHRVLPGSSLPFVLPSTAILAGVATANASGTATFSMAIPVAPWVANQMAVVQAVAAVPSLQCSGPGFTRIR